MKKITGLLFLLLITGVTTAQNKTVCQDWRISGVTRLFMPFFADQPSVDGKTFDAAALLENVQTDDADLKSWPVVTIPGDSVLTSVNSENQMVRMAGFISSDRWTKASINISTNAIFELSLNGKRVKSQGKPSDRPVKIDLTLGTGIHEMSLKLISMEKTLRFAADLSAANDSAVLSWSTNPTRTLTINDVLEGVSISGARLSNSGKYLLIQTNEVLAGSGKIQSSFQVYDMELKRNLFALRNNALRADWMPKSDRLYYQVNRNETSDVIIYDMKSGTESVAASGLKSAGRIVWSPAEDYFIYSRNEEAEKTGDLKRVFDNEDRIPGTRNRSYLYMYNPGTKVSQPLTAGSRSAMLQAISPDGRRVLFSVSRQDYSEPPFSKQTLYELEISTMRLDTIWSDKLHGGSCQYSPDGTQLLVSGGPETFGSLGVKVSEGRIPNSYDTQLFLFDLKSRKAEPLTRNFDPAAGMAYWAPDGKIYLTATERDYVNLYRLDPKRRSFTKIDVPVEVITSVDYAKNNSIAVLRGTSICIPDRLYTLDLSTGKSTLLCDPAAGRLEDVISCQTEEWNFKNSRGTTIYGRVYYPVNYDPSKMYPLIVNFYGGTTPTSRAFGGRYPKEIWAAEGYMVYVLQPSGATGFGQDFSALHVNGWGREAIDDIIEGTKKFLAAFPSADADNVGCIGASYGGFTTMMLQTRTDIFRTAIAHAGISDITSYWGEGYWGYSYSAGATTGSYPWNRRDIYVDNSPLFNADKFSNSILLLHGTADTNVPPGESLQYYAALKILGKDVEMVLVSGENHQILDYKKRIEWHNTIMSWFDMKLKNQPQHWNEMYPDKNL
ncbi:MAG TPA: prolyl oligopeptidase family serine peptidase [Bacteroidales bacterium]|jgi:dipeptidyl aminopeptidase/acylaminoacyl peptidase|nr:prolyl oligopeptidase family serine peptidase [Bacteroidales bacterium]HPA69982.1 prolyl oligopeptidase family serine peptidase [Bacteroidales bacterium]HQN59121.1 prolyl oligopeptidase family serine peptidase [Bacteroidales bacterium]